MRTRIVTCATLEGECIWYSEINFFTQLASGKAFEGFILFVGSIHTSGAGVVSENLRLTEPVLCDILGQILITSFVD